MLETNKTDMPEENKVEELTDWQLFTEVWINPRKVFRFLQAKDYNYYTAGLLVLLGIVNAFDRAQEKGMGENLDLIILLIYCVVLGGAFGWIGTYIYSYFVKIVGRWFEGKAETRELVRVFAYAAIPSITALLILIPEFLIYGESIFKNELGKGNMGTFSLVFYYFCIFAEMALGIWSILIMIVGVSEVQGFSKWKAFFNLILPFFLLVFAAIFVFVTVDLFTF